MHKPGDHRDGRARDKLPHGVVGGHDSGSGAAAVPEVEEDGYEEWERSLSLRARLRRA